MIVEIGANGRRMNEGDSGRIRSSVATLHQAPRGALSLPPLKVSCQHNENVVPPEASQQAFLFDRFQSFPYVVVYSTVSSHDRVLARIII